MERVIPLSRRKGDIVVLVFFWINILLITYIVDVEQIVLPDISGDWEYPLWLSGWTSSTGTATTLIPS